MGLREARPASTRDDLDDLSEPARALRRGWRGASLAAGWPFPSDWALPEVDRVCTAALRGEDLIGPVAELGKARARAGSGLAETLADLAALHTVLSDEQTPEQGRSRTPENPVDPGVSPSGEQATAPESPDAGETDDTDGAHAAETTGDADDADGGDERDEADSAAAGRPARPDGLARTTRSDAAADLFHTFTRAGEESERVDSGSALVVPGTSGLAGTVGPPGVDAAVGAGPITGPGTTLLAEDHVPPALLRVAAVAWADIAVHQATSTEVCDALTGLGTPAYLRTRLREVYAECELHGVGASGAYVLVVAGVDLDEGAGWSRFAAVILLADILRRLCTGGESLAGLGPSTLTALCRRDERLELNTASVRTLAEDRFAIDPQLRECGTPRVWFERLPRTHEAACALLTQLGRGS